MKDVYIVCHMMSSIDGKIDCKMLEKIPGGDNYYNTLEKLNCDAFISGRVTAEMELAKPSKFQSATATIINHECFCKNKESNKYDIILDTNGSLLWENDENYSNHHIIVTSSNVTKEYLSYLDSLNISWIVCGNDKIDLKKMVNILASEFNISRIAIVGGGVINGAFLKDELIDELSLLIGPGIDGRSSEPSLFLGLNSAPTLLKLDSVNSFSDGSIYIRYKLK